MQTNNIRVIDKSELEAVNDELSSKFGILNQIASGTCEQYEKRKKRYHIMLRDPNSYKQEQMLRRIGEKVKAIWKASEVYYFGVRIA